MQGVPIVNGASNPGSFGSLLASENNKIEILSKRHFLFWEHLDLGLELEVGFDSLDNKLTTSL